MFPNKRFVDGKLMDNQLKFTWKKELSAETN